MIDFDGGVALFDASHGRVAIHVRAGPREAAVAAVLCSKHYPEGRLAGLIFVRRDVPVLYCLAHDFAADPLHLARLYMLNRKGQINTTLEFPFQDSFRPGGSGHEDQPPDGWMVLALGFHVPRRLGVNWRRTRHRLAALPHKTVFQSPAALAAACRDLFEHAEFNPALVWAAPAWKAKPGGSPASGALRLIWPLETLSLEGAMQGCLQWGPRQPSAAFQARAAHCALHETVLKARQPAVLFRLELTNTAGVPDAFLRETLRSSLRIAHLSLRRAAVASACTAGSRAGPDQTFIRQRLGAMGELCTFHSPLAWLPMTLRATFGGDTAEWHAGEPGMGDLFAVFWRPPPEVRLSFGRPPAGNGGQRPRPAFFKDTPDRPSAVSALMQRWFLVAGEDLLDFGESRDAAARSTGLEHWMESAVRGAEAAFATPQPLGGLGERVAREFIRMARESVDHSTAFAFQRLRSNPPDPLAAHSHATFLRRLMAGQPGWAAGTVAQWTSTAADDDEIAAEWSELLALFEKDVTAAELRAEGQAAGARGDEEPGPFVNGLTLDQAQELVRQRYSQEA